MSRFEDNGTNDEAGWIADTLAGKTSAFGRLVTAYQDRLLNTLVHVTGSHEDAEDVAQEAFVQAFAKLSGFQGRASFYTWLYRIAFNLWASRCRRHRPEISVDPTRMECGDEPRAGLSSPLEQLEQKERVECIRQALARLNDEYRTILVLRDIDGNCYETIGQVLELPAGTVRSRLHRARLALKRDLEGWFCEPDVAEPRFEMPRGD